jgi:ABC-type Fe3+-hydroxamate transport system substrate-binding protein
VRVVSLVPSVTETLLAWGVEPVACTRFCEQPGLRQVGGTKDPDVAAIVGLGVDLVVMDDEENRRDDAEALRQAGVRLQVTHVRSVAEVAPALAALAVALDVPFDAAAFAAAIPAPAAASRRAFVPIWRRPWMTLSADTYGASVLAACGIASCFADAADRYPEVTLDDVRARAPDLVLLPSEPYPFAERHVAELAGVAPRIRLVDGQDLFWWGVRTPAAVARLREATAP